ncbi:MAG: hypothetical protein AB7O67_14815 [Vicinamibacterales bacterium]
MAALADDLTTYAAGLEAVLELLGRLQALAREQRAASDARDFGRFKAVADERDGVTATLVTLEAELAPLRARLGTQRQASSRLPIYQTLVERHRQARTLIDETLRTDAATVSALRDAEAARRAAAQVLETSEQTLSAYRRVISPSRTSALLDARS